MKRRIFSIIIALALCLGMMPTIALAEGESDGSIVDITNTGLELELGTNMPTGKTVYQAGEGTITVARTDDGATLTLELDNATINTNNKNGINCDIFCPLDISNAIVTLTGTNSITAGQCGLYLGQGHLKSGTQVSIQGDGSLQINAGVYGIFTGGVADTTHPAGGRTNVEFLSGNVTITKATDGFWVHDSNVTIGGTAEVIFENCGDEGFYFYWTSGDVSPDSKLTVKDSGKLTISGSQYGILAMYPNMSLNVSGNANVDINTLNHGLYVDKINFSDNVMVSAAASQSGLAVEANAIALNGPQILLPEGGKIDSYSGHQTVYDADGTTAARAVLFGVPTLSVTVSASPAEGGSVTGAGTYEKGSSATVTAAPNSGYQFVKWTKDGTEISKNNPYTFTVTEDTALTAVFEIQPAEAISVSPAALVWAQGKTNTASLTVAPQPAGANYGPVTWTSSDPEIASVDPSGVVTPGTKAGTATITATTTAGGKTLTAACAVTVDPVAEVPVRPPELVDTETEKFKVEVETGLSTVPEGLVNEAGVALTTPELVETELRAQIEQINAGIPEENTAVYDVELMVSRDGGSTWEEATQSNFPESGRLTVTLPYPAGTNSGYMFKVVHMFTTGDKAGRTEAPAVTNTAAGIQFQVTGLSPISVGWTEPPAGGGGGGSSGTTYYTLTAFAGDGGSISPSGKINVRRNSDKTFTIIPDEGYVVGDVLVDGESVGAVSEYSFEEVVKAHTIEVSFQKLGAVADCPKDETCPAHRFTDLDLNAWYHDGIHFCVERGLMSGTSATAFSPDMRASRGMIATILWRLRGSPVVNYAMQYDDVDQGAWYAEAVRWATSEKLVAGYGNGRFGPEDPITREQMAVMLYRCEQKYGSGGFTGSWMFLLDFSDADQVSTWANEAMHWMVMNKVIEGKGGKVLDPQGQLTRAEAAAMLMNYLDAYKSAS